MANLARTDGNSISGETKTHPAGTGKNKSRSASKKSVERRHPRTNSTLAVFIADLKKPSRLETDIFLTQMKSLQWVALLLVFLLCADLFIGAEAWGRRRRRRKGGGRRRRWFRRLVRKAKTFIGKHGSTIAKIYNYWRQIQAQRNEGRQKRSLLVSPLKTGAEFLSADVVHLKLMACSCRRLRKGLCKTMLGSSNAHSESVTKATLSLVDSLVSMLAMPGWSSYSALQSTDCCEVAKLRRCSDEISTVAGEKQSIDRTDPMFAPCLLAVSPDAQNTTEECHRLNGEGLARVEMLLTAVLEDLKDEETNVERQETNNEKKDVFVLV